MVISGPVTVFEVGGDVTGGMNSLDDDESGDGGGEDPWCEVREPYGAPVTGPTGGFSPSQPNSSACPVGWVRIDFRSNPMLYPNCLTGD